MPVTCLSCQLQRANGASFDERNNGTYTARYEAILSGVVGPKRAAILAQTGSPNPVPLFGASYDLSAVLESETDSYSYAKSYAVEFAEENRNVAYITVTWAPSAPQDGQLTSRTPANLAIANPFSRKAELWWDEESYVRIADKDKDGEAVINSAGQPFDRPPTIEETRGVLVAEFAVPTLSAAIALNRTYSNAVNSTTWAWAGSAPARSVVCRYARAGRIVNEGQYSYYPFSMAFAFRENGQTWDERILNEGYGYIDVSAGNNYKVFKDADGNPVQEPKLLTASGEPLPFGQSGTFQTYRLRREVDFNALTTAYLKS